MSDIAIRVENLGKRYRIGGQQAHYKTLRESLVDAAGAPLRWLKGERPPTYNDFWALDDVSFDIKLGEAVGIIGRNGAGKSTLLKVLSRITKPTRGRVELNGRVGSLLEVGTGFHPELTGRDNIFLNGTILGMSRAEITRKFDEIVDFSEVEKFLDTPVKFYSSGMYVRLAFAVAAHLEPEILIVDEVLAVGDFEFQKKSLGKMNDVAHDGRTVLFVSHNLPMVSSLCSTCILLDNGRLIEHENTAKVLATYHGTTLQNMAVSDSKSQVNTSSSKDIHLISTWVSDSSNQMRDEYSILDGIKLHVKYRVKRDLTDMIIPFFHVLNSNSEYVFLTSPYDWDPGISSDKGEYIAVCEIPAHLLNDGVYSVSVQVNSVNVGHTLEIFEHHAISFVVVDIIHDNPYRIHTKYSYEIPGEVRPLLKWQLQKTIKRT